MTGFVLQGHKYVLGRFGKRSHVVMNTLFLNVL